MRFNTMLFNVVEKCDIRCRHCGYADSKRPGMINEAQLVDWTTQAVEYGIKQITFSGGEVFTELDLLASGVAAVRRAGGGSGVFTNGRWGQTEDSARATLARLEGLTHLHLSCDVYHLEWVPVQSLLNIIRASREMTLKPTVIINVCYTNEQDKQMVTDLFAEERGRIAFHYQKVIPSDFVQLRVRDVTDDSKALKTLDFGHSCYLHTPTVHTSGHLWACHIGTIETHPDYDVTASPYYLGNLREESMQDIFERAENNPVYQMLRVFGPRLVAQAAMSSEVREELGEQRYASDCDMCYQVLARREVQDEIRRRASEPQSRTQLFLSRVLQLRDGL